jgi:hypothetical protein
MSNITHYKIWFSSRNAMQINILLQSATIWLRRWKKWSECLEEHQASVVNEILISRRLKNLCFSIAFCFFAKKSFCFDEQNIGQVKYLYCMRNNFGKKCTLHEKENFAPTKSRPFPISTSLCRCHNYQLQKNWPTK